MFSSVPMSEQYRPRTFADVVGQDVAIAKIQTVLSRGWGGRCWWISGPAGHGKTTLARIIAEHGANELAITECDASELTLPRLESMRETLSMFGPGLGGRAVIVNEAHGLRRGDVLRQLLTMIDRQPRHVVWLFTMTDAGEQYMLGDIADSGPLMSRCQVIRLAASGFEREIAKAIRKRAGGEHSLADLTSLVRRCNSDMRAIWNAIESGDIGFSTIATARECAGCGTAIVRGKYCSTACYLNWLRARKLQVKPNAQVGSEVDCGA